MIAIRQNLLSPPSITVGGARVAEEGSSARTANSYYIHNIRIHETLNGFVDIFMGTASLKAKGIKIDTAYTLRSEFYGAHGTSENPA